MPYPLKFESFGESGILISWPNEINHSISRDVFNLNLQIHKHLSALIQETVPAYCSLTVFVNSQINKTELMTNIKNIYQSIEQYLTVKPNSWQIPVCYDLLLGLDLEKLADLKGISIDEVIKRHSQALYTVDFFGFLPGFPYLSGLDKKLHTPRLAKPRTFVAKGSVAIGGEQTGIYPSESPGGWHIIGRTPVTLFSPQKAVPCVIKPLDKINLVPISLDEFNCGDFQLVKDALK